MCGTGEFAAITAWRVRALNNVDLPTLGSPTNPIDKDTGNTLPCQYDSVYAGAYFAPSAKSRIYIAGLVPAHLESLRPPSSLRARGRIRMPLAFPFRHEIHIHDSNQSVGLHDQLSMMGVGAPAFRRQKR